MEQYRNSNFQSQQESHRNTNCDGIYNIGMQIGDRIRDARKRMKLTQAQLAKKVGMSQGALSELETGASEGTTLIATFAAVLGVNALWLETGRGDRAPGDEPPADVRRLQVETPEEMRLLTAFRLADDIGRDQLNSAVDAVLSGLEQTRRYK